MTSFDFTERQAQAIIELQLQRLTGMERQKIIDELAEIQTRIAGYLEILGSDQVLRKLIIKELKEVQKKFGDDRRTEITGEANAITLEDLVPDEDMTITVTHNGYLKRTPNDTYRKQSRGGRGRIGMGMRGEDFVEDMFTGSTHSYLLVFTNLGRVYWLKVYSIPDVGTTGKGKHIANLVSLQPEEKVQAFLPVREFEEGRYVIIATAKGVIKKCDLTVFDHPLTRGIIAIALDEGDQLISARLTNGEPEIFLATYHGKAIRFTAEDVRPMGRPARGVRAIRLGEGDSVIGMAPVAPGNLMLSVTEAGYGKRTELEEYRLTARGGKGVINIKTSKRNGNVVALMRVVPEDELMIITRNGKIIRLGADKIRATGRSAQGVRLVKLEDGDEIAAACVVPPDENGEDEGPDGQGVLIQ